MKLYKNMTEEEQLQWVTDFSDFCADGLATLEQPGWSQECNVAMEKGLELIRAFDFALRFASKTLEMGDYECRVPRLRHYVEQIKEQLTATATITGSDGKQYAYVPSLAHEKKRGRPSAEEKANRKQVENATSTKIEKKLADLTGLKVIEAPVQREKNNEELAQEREERKAEQERISPSMFQWNQGLQNLDSTEKLHLSELRFLMSEELAGAVDNIRMLRGQAASAAEHAKALAEQGADAKEIMPYAQQAADYTEQYENIYGRVDTEMAEVYIRLCEDEKFRSEWEKKADITALKKWTRPYLQKMEEGFTETIRKKIAAEQPEAAAKKAQEEADRKEVAAIRKYMLRTDKPNTAKRIQGMEKKYQRLVALIGEEEAKTYLPIINKAKEELKNSIK